MCSWAPYLFDYKPRFIKFFFHHFMRLTVKGGLHFLLFYFIERYGWCSVFPWLPFVDQIILSHSIVFSITCTSVTGGIMIKKTVVVVQASLIRERTSTRTSRMHLRGFGNLCSSVVYNQRRLTIELIRQAHNRLQEKGNENVANQRKNKLCKRWRHEIRHRGPPVKIASDPTL